MERTDFLSIINSGDFDRLKGEPETDWLDCKREIYSLKNDDKAKLEFVKDISSFANASAGGYILIGVETNKSSEFYAETIHKIHPMSQDTIDTEQLQNVIKDWLYPNPVVDIEWKKDRDSDKGIWIITIRAQHEARKPFLITKTLDDSGKRIETLFGYAERKRTNSEHKKIAELHQLVRDGLSYGTTITNRFDDINALLQKFLPSTANATGGQSILNKDQLESEIKEKIGDAIGAGGLANRRLFILTGYTSEQTDISVWFDSQSQIVKALEDPPSLRLRGWDIKSVGNHSKIIRGELRRIKEDQIKILDLYRNGVTIFAAVAEPAFLAWEPLKIRPLSLIEVIYNYIVFFRSVINNFNQKPLRVFVRVDFRGLHLNGERTYMVAGSNVHSTQRHASPSDAWFKEIPFDVDRFDEGQVAYRIVQEIYLWFGMGSDAIPYVSGSGIDVDQIKNLH